MRNLISGILLFVVIVAGAQTTYYIDDVAGDDSNKGISARMAWQFLDKINNIVLVP